jgi:hypothetical protein
MRAPSSVNHLYGPDKTDRSLIAREDAKLAMPRSIQGRRPSERSGYDQATAMAGSLMFLVLPIRVRVSSAMYLRVTVHSSLASIMNAPTRGITAPSLGAIPTTSDRYMISLITRCSIRATNQTMAQPI